MTRTTKIFLICLIILCSPLSFSTQRAVKPSTLHHLLHQANDPIGGDAKGKVSLVEFYDYQCFHCVNMAPVIDSLIKANPKLRVVYKQFPIQGPMSESAARAALAANKQGKFKPFSEALFHADQPLTREVIFKVAKTAGLNVEQLKKDMDNELITMQIQSNLILAKELGLSGTPAFFIGNSEATDIHQLNFVLGQLDQDKLQSLINNANH